VLNVGTGEYLVGNDLATIYRHEMGHHIQNNSISSWEWGEALKNTKKAFSVKAKTMLPKAIEDLEQKYIDANKGWTIKTLREGKQAKRLKKQAEDKIARDLMAQEISGYASQDSYEAFAESFAAYTSPSYKKGMLPKPIEDFMIEYIK